MSLGGDVVVGDAVPLARGLEARNIHRLDFGGDNGFHRNQERNGFLQGVQEKSLTGSKYGRYRSF